MEALMLLTTDEASGRICPVMTLNGKPITCATYRCMFWRWAAEEVERVTIGRNDKPPAGEGWKPVNGQPPDTRLYERTVHRGFCGQAGDPIFPGPDLPQMKPKPRPIGDRSH
jgi:hypothetical protein